jgi:hypothetical protein
MAREDVPAPGRPGRRDPDKTRVVRPLTPLDQVKHLLPQLAEPELDEVARLVQELLRQQRGESP